MKVTAIKRFAGHQPGETFEIANGQARVLIKAKIVREAEDTPAPQYKTRMLTADDSTEVSEKPAKRTYTRRKPAKE